MARFLARRDHARILWRSHCLRRQSKKELLLWDVPAGQLRSRPVGVLLGDEVRVMAFLDRGRLLAVVTRDSSGIRTVRVWDLNSDIARPRLRYSVAGFGFVMVSPDGRFNPQDQSRTAGWPP